MKQAKKRSSSSRKPSKTRASSKSAATSAKASHSYSKKVAQKRRVKRDAKARRKADYLATLPKSRIKRIAYRLHPRRLYKYWFSKDGVTMAIKITGAGFAVIFVMSLGVFAYFRKDLPNPREINSRVLSQSTKFFDRTGEHLLYEVYGDENRTIVSFDKISDNAKWATVAVEDKDFYEHGGVSFSGIARAAWSNVASGDATGQGGSTITQQFIKNSLLTTDQTYTRKVQEIILALELERLYSKEEILSFYLNEIPYGPQEYGIEAAAQSFFRKNASELTIAESSMLAALPQAPTYFSPYGDHTDDLIDRQHVIINLMRDQGYITDEQATEAKDADILASITPLDERSLYNDIIAPHFVLQAQSQLEEDFTAPVIRNGGYKVITTLDVELQEIAEKAVKDADNGGFCDRNGKCGDNAAIVASDTKTGQVTALVGSRNFNYPGYGSFNAALADRQPGSSFKPFDYAQLFYNDRWGPDSFIYDTSTSWGDWKPKNFDGGFRKQMRVRQAIGESRNIPAVKAMDIATVDATVGLAIAMGNTSLADDPSYDLSYALGAGEVKLAEHTHAYGTFARGGKYVEQSYILKVEDSNGETLFEWEQDAGEQVLDEEIAYLITDVLKDDVARSRTFGANNSNLVVPGLLHTVKTGSTDESVDGLMMGYSAHMAVGVWVGNHDNTPMDSFTSHQTGPIFTQFLREAHEKKNLDFGAEIQERPAGVKSIKLSTQTGYAADETTKQTYTGLFPSWHKPETSSDTQKFTIDKISEKLATDCTPERAKEEKSGLGKWPEVLSDDYRFTSWSKTAGYGDSGSGPKEEDDVHKCSDDLPQISLDITPQGGGEYKFEAEVQNGTFDLDTLNFKVDGQIVNIKNSVSKSGGKYQYNHTFSSNGNYNVSAEIIDKGLYDNTSSQTLPVNDVSASFEILSHNHGDTSVDPNTVFIWDTVVGADQYNFCYMKQSQPAFTCLNNGNSNSFSPGLLPFSSYKVRVDALSGGSDSGSTSTIIISTGN